MEREKFADLNVYFNFENHAKLVMTDTIAYIGSQNFSDASQDKVELGFLVQDPYEIRQIKDQSIRYATSEYTILMEENADIMRNSLDDMRQDIFSIARDPPYTPEIEIFSMEHAFFHREKWEVFKGIHFRFEDIVNSLIDDYPTNFNNAEAEDKVKILSGLVNDFVAELDELEKFSSQVEESMMWCHFREIDTGDNMDEALETANDYVREYKQEKFAEIEEKGTKLIYTFDTIEECIKQIETLIDEIKDEMIRQSVYKNIKLIKNYKVYTEPL